MDKNTATFHGMTFVRAPSIREAAIDALARRIAKREAGEGSVVMGYEEQHRAAAEEYVDVVLRVAFPTPPV